MYTHSRQLFFFLFFSFFSFFLLLHTPTRILDILRVKTEAFGQRYFTYSVPKQWVVSLLTSVTFSSPMSSKLRYKLFFTNNTIADFKLIYISPPPPLVLPPPFLSFPLHCFSAPVCVCVCVCVRVGGGGSADVVYEEYNIYIIFEF